MATSPTASYLDGRSMITDDTLNISHPNPDSDPPPPPPTNTNTKLKPPLPIPKPNSKSTLKRPAKNNEPGNDSKRVNKKGTDAAATADRNSYLIRLNKHLQINEKMLKKAIDLMEESKLKEFEEQWKQLQDAEDKLKVKRAELVSDHMVMILEAAMSSTDYDWKL